ncbi:MAG: Hpt domain-containing protein [Bdellovibrionales bacterium]|nr:Hpt domain-containing protein [Bdellovibrionales bacterium]
MDDFELEIKKEFLNEALINLEEVESSFMELEASKDSKPLLDKIFRLAHNLKGGSRAVGFGDIAEFTHQLESLVLKIKNDEIKLCSPLITLLLRSNDRLIEMLLALKENLTATFNNSEMLSEFKLWLEGLKNPLQHPLESTLELAPRNTTSPLSPNVPMASDFFFESPSPTPPQKYQKLQLKT